MIAVEDKYMSRCLELAYHGLGHVAPNPMVGAVLVHEGRIIGEGFHRAYGGAHAEVNAISSVRERSLIPESTLYVSLEPCSHYGKTPPCAELILRERIPRVVIGCLDPYPAVSGRGVRRLLEKGVDVVTGVMEESCRRLNKAFVTFHLRKRPYILLKWAQSSDGFMDFIRQDASVPPASLSPAESLRRVHRMRSEVDAIMVGTNTALLDNPSLTVRHWAGYSPVRVVIDRDLRIPSSSHLLDGTVRTLVFTARKSPNAPGVEYYMVDFNKQVMPQILDRLYLLNLTSLMVEGGPKLLASLLADGLWDEMFVETVPLCLGSGVRSPAIPNSAIFSFRVPIPMACSCLGASQEAASCGFLTGYKSGVTR